MTKTDPSEVGGRRSGAGCSRYSSNLSSGAKPRREEEGEEGLRARAFKPCPNSVGNVLENIAVAVNV